ncbi:MAG: hypothetical protein ACOVP2_01895 [Armatimonadaceae bacterium]
MPGAGHVSRPGLQASEHSASIRAGTVHDGQNQQTVNNPPTVTIGDGRPTGPHHATDKPSRTDHETEFSYHPARSAQSRCIHPASAASASAKPISVSIPAGGHGSPHLRRGFFSANNHMGAVNTVSCSSITVRTNKRESAMPGGM